MAWRALFAAALMSFLTPALALTPLQAWAANDALHVGAHWGRTLQAIIGQESSYCLQDKSQLPTGQASTAGIATAIPAEGMGCGQLLLATAQMIDPMVTGEDLRFDRARNIIDASLYLDYCMAKALEWRRGVACYRYGWPKASAMTERELITNRYVRSIVHRMLAGA